MPELTSSHLVDAIDNDLRSRLENLETRPRLSILSDNLDHSPSLMYVGIKQRVARNLGINATALFTNNTEDLIHAAETHSQDPNYHAMIIQLPLSKRSYTDKAINLIPAHKDVDGLASEAEFTPATPLGILNLIEGYGINYQQSRVAIMGKGRLVGAPLLRLMKERGADDICAFDISSTQDEIREGLNRANIVISAVGQPGLLSPHMFDEVESKRVFIDAGAAESGGVVVGDVSDGLRERVLSSGSLITPKKGGIGPMTVRALLSNVVSAAEKQTQ